MIEKHDVIEDLLGIIEDALNYTSDDGDCHTCGSSPGEEDPSCGACGWKHKARAIIDPEYWQYNVRNIGDNPDIESIRIGLIAGRSWVSDSPKGKEDQLKIIKAHVALTRITELNEGGIK